MREKSNTRMVRYVIRYGVGIVLVLLILYLYMLFISVYQEVSGGDVRVEAVVEEIRIAYPTDPWRRWVVVFRLTGTLNGRGDAETVAIQVHSPSADLGVLNTGQKVVLIRRGSVWSTDDH